MTNLENIQEIFQKNELLNLLGVKLETFSKQSLAVSLAVSEKHHQPFGIMHGGISLLLAETAASMAGQLNIMEGQKIVGAEINANHLRQVVKEKIIATATPIHLGKRTHVWQVEIKNEKSQLICVGRCTLVVV